jgi:hypothetical protein
MEQIERRDGGEETEGRYIIGEKEGKRQRGTYKRGERRRRGRGSGKGRDREEKVHIRAYFFRAQRFRFFRAFFRIALASAKKAPGPPLAM